VRIFPITSGCSIQAMNSEPAPPPASEEFQAAYHLFLIQGEAQPRKAPKQDTQRELIRDNHPRVRTTLFHSLPVQACEIAPIMSEKDAPSLNRIFKLGFVRLLPLPRLLSGEDVNASLAQCGGQRYIHILVQIEADLHAVRFCRMNSSRFASRSASISPWWS
jgi:hypothetical protein